MWEKKDVMKQINLEDNLNSKTNLILFLIPLFLGYRFDKFTPPLSVDLFRVNENPKPISADRLFASLVDKKFVKLTKQNCHKMSKQIHELFSIKQFMQHLKF